MGATISPDYLAVGYRFDNVKPIAIVEGTYLVTQRILNYTEVS
jgi:hypothetical protein